MTALFSAEPALKRGTLLAAIWIFSPVCGFTPWRALRSATENFPKPVKLTSPPRGQNLLKRVENGVDGLAGLALPEPALVRDPVDELVLRHDFLLAGGN